MAIQNVDLRPAKFSDHIAIAKLHADSWRQNYRGICSDRFLKDEVDQNRLKGWHKKLSSPATNQFSPLQFLIMKLLDSPAYY